MEYQREGLKRFNEKEITIIVCVISKIKTSNGYKYLFSNCIITKDFEYINHMRSFEEKINLDKNHIYKVKAEVYMYEKGENIYSFSIKNIHDAILVD